MVAAWLDRRRSKPRPAFAAPLLRAPLAAGAPSHWYGSVSTHAGGGLDQERRLRSAEDHSQDVRRRAADAVPVAQGQVRGRRLCPTRLPLRTKTACLGWCPGTRVIRTRSRTPWTSFWRGWPRPANVCLRRGSLAAHRKTRPRKHRWLRVRLSPRLEATLELRLERRGEESQTAWRQAGPALRTRSCAP